MNVMDDVAEARASALSLRASARACGPEQGALRFRLTRAAESLDTVVVTAVRGIERIEKLECELRQLKGAGRKPGKVLLALSPAEDADIGDALRAVHERLEHARERVAEGMRRVDRYDHAIITATLVLLDQHTSVALTDARIERDSMREQAMHAMSRQLARLRARLRVMDVTP